MTRPLFIPPTDWRLVTLEANKDLGVIIEVGSGSTPPTNVKEYWDGHYPWLTPKEMTSPRSDRYIRITERTITEEGLKQAGDSWPKGTVMLTKRAPVGAVAFNEVPMAINQGILAFRCGKDILPEFLFYWFKANGRYLDAVANGSTYPELYPGDLFEFEIGLPSIDEQHVIIQILKTLDEKIELNRRMNTTLENISRALFKSWFVDFDPVVAKRERRKIEGMNEKTASLFPSDLTTIQETLIPLGWKIGVLGDIATNPRHNIQANDIEDSTPFIGLDHMPRKCLALSEWSTADELESNKTKFKRGEILFGKLRPYFHKVGIAPFDGVCSTDILVVNSKSPLWYSYVCFQVSSKELIQYTDACSTGTKMPRTNWQDMASYKIIIPPEPITAEFNKIVLPMIELIIANIHESHTLEILRDAILIKLISGNIRLRKNVKEATA